MKVTLLHENALAENCPVEEYKECIDVSDGSHTFTELYYHRMILFSVICNNTLESWKSKLHHDDTMYKDYFIVGVETPEGQFSYHYHVDAWDRFKVKEVEKAPPFDGHTSSDVTRLLTLF